jgi:hypothetical protein
MSPTLFSFAGKPAWQGPRPFVIATGAVVAMLILFVGSASIQAQSASIERVVFNTGDSLETIRATYHARLRSKLNAIDDECQLRLDQMRKLELAGTGDIKRFFDQCVALNDQTSEKEFLAGTRSFHMEGTMLRIKASSDLHHGGSLLGKSIQNILTPEQSLRYRAMIASECHQITEEAISRLDALFIEEGDWPGQQRLDFQIFLRTKLKPVRNSGTFGFICLAAQLGRVDRTRYENLLPEKQRTLLRLLIEHGLSHEAGLRQAGFFAPDKNEENEEG